MSWIIELRAPEEGARYFMKRARGVTHDSQKAKIFADKTEAVAVMAQCTLWPDRKVVKLT